MDDSQTDGESGQGRSFPLFDPVAGMRAVADIQAEGLRTAGELLERVLGSEPDRSGPRPPRPAGDYTALVDAWVDLIRRTVAGVAEPSPRGAVTVPVGSNGVGPLVRLELQRPKSGDGAEADSSNSVAEVWLHNGTSSPVGPLSLRSSALTDSDGTTLESAYVRFDPPEVPLLPARSSRAVVLSLAAGDSPRPGVYRGTIQAAGDPNLWLPLEVVIESC